MPFSEDDKILIKGLRQEKHYGAKRLKTEFPNKCWTLIGLKKLIRKIDDTGSVKRKSGSGRKRTVSTAENIECVSELVLSQENQPGSQLCSSF